MLGVISSETTCEVIKKVLIHSLLVIKHHSDHFISYSRANQTIIKLPLKNAGPYLTRYIITIYVSTLT